MAATFAFTKGQSVQVFDRNGSRTWRPATIDSLAGYRGRPGYYISWQFSRRKESWESGGGWVQEQDVKAIGPRPQAAMKGDS